MTKENSLRIDFLKFVCAILVVAIHTPFPKGEVWSCSWILCHIFSKLTCVAVPFFFLCSGYFLAKHLDTHQNWWQAVRKRVRTLVVPFLIWTWIFAAYLILIRCATDLLLGRPLGSTAFDFINWLSLFGIDWRNYTLLGPLWYVRDLFFLVLTAPIISYFIKKMGIAWVALCFCGAILYWLIPGEAARHFFYYDYSLSGLFYFSCGIYFFRRNRELLFPFQNKLMGGGLIVLFLVIGALFLAAKGLDDAQHMLDAIAIPFIIFFAWHFAPAHRLPKWLEDMSFPIFILHMFFVVLVGGVGKYCPVLKDLPRTCVVLSYIVGVVGSILLAHALRRYFPRFARVAFGER